MIRSILILSVCLVLNPVLVEAQEQSKVKGKKQELTHGGRPLKEWIDHVRGGGHRVDALWKLGQKANEENSKKIVAALLSQMNRKDMRFRGKVLHALGQIGPKASDAVPKIIPYLDEKESRRIRYWACFALGKIGARSGKAIPKIIKILEDPNSDLALDRSRYRSPRIQPENRLRYRACNALGLIAKNCNQKEADLAVNALIKELAVSKFALRGSLIESLGTAGPRASKAVPELLKIVNGKSYHKRHSISALGQIGPTASAAIPALLAISKDSKDPERTAAVNALSRIAIGNAAVVKELKALQQIEKSRSGPWNKALEDALKRLGDSMKKNQ